MENKSAASGGIGFGGLLCIAFIVLKLCNVINWNWWWVLSPIWIPVAIIIVGLLFVGIAYFFKYRGQKKRIASGMNEWAWRNRKKHKEYHGLTPPTDPVIKSKWQQRMEEMQKQQKDRR